VLGWNIAVCVPSHRQRPGVSGAIRTGTGIFASSSREVSGTIGALKLTET
jgi:hypothetical protein